MVIVDLLPLVPYDTATGTVADVLRPRGHILMLVPSSTLLSGCQDHPHVIAAHKAYAEYQAAMEDEILNGDGTDAKGGLLP
jgi:hypothetical protein